MTVDRTSNLIVRRLVEANVVGTFVWNLDGAITGANEAFLRIVNYDREDLASGRVRWTDLTPAEWCDRDERALAELRASGIFQPYEKEYFRKDGSRVPILLGGALSEDSGNEGVAFVLDLSEQKRAERMIREQEMKLQQIMDFTPLFVAVLGPREEPIYANRALLEFFGLRLEGWQGQDAQTRFHPEDLEQIRWGLDGGPPDKYEARIMRHDGKYRWFLVRNNALRDEKGQVMCWFVSGIDIEDRKQAEQLHADLTQVWQSVSRSSNRKAVGFGPKMTAGEARRSTSPCQPFARKETLPWIARDSAYGRVVSRRVRPSQPRFELRWLRLVQALLTWGMS